MKSKVKTWLNAEPTKGEVNRQPSMTIPDQTMSLREILQRFAQGLPVTGAKVPVYDEENDLPDIRTLDLAERDEYANQFANEFAEIKGRESRIKAAQHKKDMDELAEFRRQKMAGGSQPHGAMPQAPIKEPIGDTP